MKASELIKVLQYTMEEEKEDFEIECRVKDYKTGKHYDGDNLNYSIRVFDDEERPRGILEFVTKEKYYSKEVIKVVKNDLGIIRQNILSIMKALEEK